MNDIIEAAIRTGLIGIGATAVLDLWNLALKRAFALPFPDYPLVGRWIAGIPQGRFVNKTSVAKAPPARGERVIGWTAHYAIGIGFAALTLAIFGLDWARTPTFLPAFAVGVVSVVAPLFVMQPGMGAGIAASKTPKPTQARLRSLLSHAVFGVGLYLAGAAAAALLPV